MNSPKFERETSFILNDDCLRIIVSFCAGDTITMANLLRVSKQWFKTVVPVLYARPFAAQSASDTFLDDDPRVHGYAHSLSQESRKKLFVLLSTNSGFCNDKRMKYATTTSTMTEETKTTATTTTTTVNYFEFVKEFPFEKVLDFCNVDFNGNFLVETDQVLCHIEYHGSRFKTFSLFFDLSLNFIWENDLMAKMPNLEKLTLPFELVAIEGANNNNNNSNDNDNDDGVLSEQDNVIDTTNPPKITPAAEEMTEKIVQRHVTLYPNMLSELTWDQHSDHWDLYLRLLSKMAKPKKYTFRAIQASIIDRRGVPISFEGYEDALAKESVKSLNFELLDINVMIPGLTTFLQKCRNVETLSVVGGPAGMFEWAKEESEKFEEWEQQQQKQSQRQEQYQQQHSSQNSRLLSSSLPAQPPALVPIQKLSLSGPSKNIHDTVYAFRYTLQELELHVDTPSLLGSTHERWSTFQLSSLKILKTRDQLVELDFLSHCCPNLEEIDMNGEECFVWIQRVAPFDPLTGTGGLPRKLRVLKLTGSIYFLGLPNIGLLLQPLHYLETLELIGGDYGQWPVDMTGNDVLPNSTVDPVTGEKKIHYPFPNLKSLCLEGHWCVKFGGKLLKASPNLEEAIFSLRATYDPRMSKFDLDTFLPYVSDPDHESQSTSDQGMYPKLKRLKFENADIVTRSDFQQEWQQSPNQDQNRDNHQCLRLEDLILVEKSPFPNLEVLWLQDLRWKSKEELDGFISTVMMKGQEMETIIPRLQFVEINDGDCRANYKLKYHLVNVDDTRSFRQFMKERKLAKECALKYGEEYFLPKK